MLNNPSFSVETTKLTNLSLKNPAPKSSRDIERDVPGDVPGIIPGEIPGDIPRYITV